VRVGEPASRRRRLDMGPLMNHEVAMDGA